MVELVLQLRAEVGGKLAYGVDGRPPDPRMRIVEGIEHHPDHLIEILSHDLGAALCDLRYGDERGVPSLPLVSTHKRREQLSSHGQDGVPADGDGEPVEALLREHKAPGLPGVFFFGDGGVPRGLVVDVEQHGHDDGEEPADVSREAAHHAGRALAGLGEGDDELDGEMARAVLEAGRLGDVQHGCDDVGQLAAEEARLGAGEVDHHLERLLRGALVAAVEGVGEGAHHGGEQVLEPVAGGGGGEGLDDADGGVEAGHADVRGGGVGEG